VRCTRGGVLGLTCNSRSRLHLRFRKCATGPVGGDPRSATIRGHCWQVGEGSPLWSILGPSDAWLPLHSEPDQCSRPDGDHADLMSAFVSSRFVATPPFARGEHFPATPLVRCAIFRHPASYLTWSRHGKARGARVCSNVFDSDLLRCSAAGAGLPGCGQEAYPDRCDPGGPVLS